MNLNQLFFDHQFALMHADHARSADDRRVHADLVGYCAGRIRKFRHNAGLPGYAWRQGDAERRSDGGA